MKILSSSVSDTEAAGETLSKFLHSGDVVALFGALGAGKTAFVRGLARGLGVKSRVTSPTFAIVNEYKGNVPVYHFDMYRLTSVDELFDIGWEDYLNSDGVIVTEWSENIEEALPERRFDVRIDIRDEHTREITVDERKDAG